MHSTPLNVLYLHSHDTGRYVQPYGCAVATPKLQRLAEDGVLFRQAFCASPTCSPSRAALLTGMWPHCNGMIGLAHRGARLHDPSRHLASFLARHGYLTALAGTHHEAPWETPQLLGYQRILERETAAKLSGDPNENIARLAGGFLARPHDQPFFLSCGFGLTHRTGTGMQWHNGDKSPLGDPRYVRPPAPLPDLPETRRDFADFAMAVQHLDHCMGLVCDALEAADLAESTLLICTTDHGIAFPFMKCNLTDHGIGVMLLLRGPLLRHLDAARGSGGQAGGFRGGKVMDAMVSHLDVFPTICELAGMPPPDWLQGRSLCELVDGGAPKVHEEIFAEVNYHAAYEPMRAVRTTRYKYIRRFNVRPGPVLPNCDDSISKQLLLAHGWAQLPQSAECLYDLVFDPNEACNLAGQAAQADVLADMRTRLERWMRETDDPLLSGKIKPWPGMVVNPAAGMSPQEPTVDAALSGDACISKPF